MSESVVQEVETDVVQPARTRGGVYKLCMACGQNMLRAEYRAGSSICPRCEQREEAQEPAEAPDQPPALVEVTEAHAPAAVPMPPGGVCEGSAEAVEWLHAQCGRAEGTDVLMLDRIVAVMRAMQAEKVEMIGRVTRYGAQAAEVRPEDVPLEVAATTLWLACDPVLQERLTAAQELLGLALHQVMLGNLAYHEQDLLNQNQSLVRQASLAVQYGTGRGRGLLTQGNPGRTGIPGGRLVDANGQLVKDCLCCGREFHPPRDRPNPDFCDEGCGTFADQLRIWATNTVLNELRYPGSTDPMPMPDPRTFWQVERCQEPYLSAAMQFRDERVRQQMTNARDQQQKMRGLA